MSSYDLDGMRRYWFRCDACGLNARGSGRWAGEDEIEGMDTKKIPVVRDNRTEPSTLLAVYGEPRQDIEEDSALWARLLTYAWTYDANHETWADDCVFHNLWGLRCMGARLKRGATGWVLRPEYHEQGFESTDEWQDIRARYLVPHEDTIKLLLSRLSEPVGVAV